MNDKQQQLYNYLKENGLTDLDANTFFSKYSDQGKAREVWSYLKNEGMTDLDADSFYSSYFKKKSQGTTASTSGTGSSASSNVEVFTGYPGKEEKPYKFKDGKWYEESGVKVYGQKEAQYAQITDPNRIKNLNRQFKKDASVSQEEQIYTNYDEEKKDNLYRIYDGRWQRQTPGSKWHTIENEGSINALNKRYGKSVSAKTVATTTLPPKEFKDINSSLVAKTEESAIDYLNKNYSKYGFEFSQEGAFFIDQIKVKTKDGRKEETFEFDEKNPEQAAKLRAFLEQNASKPYSESYKQAVDALNKTQGTKSTGPKMGTGEYGYERESAITRGKNLNSSTFQSEFKKLSFEEQKEIINDEIMGTKLPTTDLDKFYKSSAYQDYKKKKVAGDKSTEQTLNVLYDELNYAKASKDPVKIKEAKNKINSYLTDEVIQDNVKQYDMRLNDLKTSTEAIKSDTKAYESEVARFNELAKSGAMTQEQFNEQKSLLEDKAESIQTRAQNLQMEREQIIASQKKLNLVAGKYIAAKEKEGNILGFALNKVLSGVSMTIVEPFANLEALGRAKYEELSPEEKAYYKSLTYNGKNLTTDQIENYLDNKAILKAKKEAKESIIKAVGNEGTTLEYMNSSDRGWFTQAIGGVLESLPAMATGVFGKAASFTGLAAQAYSGIEEEMLSDPDFQYSSSLDRALIAVPYAAAMGALENIGLTNMIKADSYAGKVLMGVALKAAEKVGGKATKETLERIAAKEIENLVAKGAIKITQAGLAEFETGLTQSLVLDQGWKNVANWWMSKDLTKEEKKKLTNNEFFDTADGFIQTASQVFEDGLAEMVGGKVLSTVGVISERLMNGNISLYNQDDVKFLNTIATDTEFKKLMVANLKTQMINGNLTKSQAQEQLDAVNKIDGVMSSMPEQLSDRDRMNAFNLIVERDRLQQEIDKSDPALVTAQKERVAEINNQLDKISKDAVQKQAAGEVPVQPGTEISGEMAQREPETGLEEATKKGKEEVAQYIADMGAEARLGATINPIMEKMSNAEFINDNDIDTAIEAIFNEVEQLEKSDKYSPETKAAMSEKLLNIADKLDNYEFRTKTETVATTKAGAASPTRRTSEAVQKIRAEKYFNGVEAEVNGQQVTLSDNNGRVEAAMPNGEVIVIDTPTMEINEDGFEFDDNGALQAVVVTDRLGNTVKLTGEQALDFAIRDRENKLGVVEQAEFETVYQEVEKQYIKENLQDTQKQTNLAQDEKGKPKAGNRLFNEPLKAVAEIANRYFQRVFGSQRPTYEGTTEFDVERAKRIAAAYEAMEDNPNDPEVRRAYEAMAKETIEQYKAFLDAGYVVEINNEEPYANSEEMIEDLRNNKRIRIFSTEAGFGDTPITPEQRAANPLLATTEFTDVNNQPMLVNDLFRAVHDFFGHAELGNSFGPKGEENAWNVHARMYSPLARRAMTTETRGQNSWVNFSSANEDVELIRQEAVKLREQGKLDEAAALVNQIYDEAKFADQKIGLLPEEFSMIDGEVQETVDAEANLITEKNAKLMSVKFKRNPIVRAALNIMKALPGVKIYLHEDTDQYASTLADRTGESKQSITKENSAGSYIDGEIHIDMTKADMVTLLHEAVHHAFASLGVSENLFIDLAKGLRPLITNKTRLAELDAFIDSYDGDELKAEEFMAQLGGILADNREELTVSKLTQFKALINRLMKKIGLGVIFKASATTKEAADLINAITFGISTGSKISDQVVGKTGKAKRQAVTIMQGKESMKKFGLKEGKNVTRKIGEALEARQRAKYGTIAQKDNSPEARKKISNWMVDEVKYFTELMGDKSGKGWYGELYQKSLDAMSKIFPEMKTDQNARDLFTMLVAITSDGQKVMTNFKLASEAYDYYKKNGVMPVTLSGLRVASFEANLKRINELLVEYNGDIAAIKKDLMDVRSIQDINKERKTEGLPPLKTSWPVSFKAPFAASVFGAKLGMFFSNLSGNEAYPTLDRWWSRTFNRYRGTLIPGLKSGFTKKGEAIGLDRFKGLLGNPGMSNEEALLASKSYRDSYAAKGYKNGTEVEKAANTIYKTAFENINDAPFNGGDRKFMYDTISDAVNKLNKDGYELSIADVQAILWYFEKNLYKTLGVQAKIEGISYEDAANYTYDKWKESGQKFNYEIKAEEEGQSVEDADEDIEEEEAKPIKRKKQLIAPNGKPSKLNAQQWEQVRTPAFKKWFGDWENDPENASKVVDENGEPRVVFHGTNAEFDEFKSELLGSKNWLADSAYMGFFFAGNQATSEAYTGMNSSDMIGLNISDSPILKRANEKYGKEIQDVKDSIKEVYQKEFDDALDKRKKELIDGLTEDVIKIFFPKGITNETVNTLISFEKREEISKKADKINKDNGNAKKLEDLEKKAIKYINDEFIKDRGLKPQIMNLFLNIRNPKTVAVENRDEVSLPYEIQAAKDSGNDGVIFNNLKDGAEEDDIFVAFKPNQVKSATENVGTFSPKTANIKFQKAPKILGGKPTQVIVKDEYKALLDQIKLEARAQREQKREHKKILADISATVTSLKSKGNISVKQFDFIMKKLKGLNFDNKQKVSEFIDYVSRALANAEYIDNVQKAKRMSKAIASKLKGKPNPFAIVAKMFTSLDAEYVENVVDHIAVAQMIMDGVKSSSTRGGKLTLKQEPDLQVIAEYIDAEQQRQTQRLFKNLQARYENITGKPSTNLPAETMLTELEALKPDVDNSADILDQIDLQLAAYSQLIDEDTPQVIIDAINIDTEEFGIADSIKVLDALDTYFANGVTSGIESLMGAYEGMMNAKKFKFKSSPMSIAMSEKLGRTRLGLFAGFSRILERKFRSVDKANAYQKASGINDIIVGANKADFEATFKQSEYIRKFGKMKGFFSNENIYERGIIADLIRTNPNIDQDAEFDRLINILMDSKNMLLQSSDETKVRMGRLYDKVFKKLGLYNANVTLESVLAKAEQMNIDAVNFAVDMFAEKYEQMSDTAMGVYNIMLNQDINYTPKTYVNIKQGQSKDSDALSGSDVLGIGQYSNNYFNRNEAGVLMPITRPKDLKSNGKYVDLNFDNNMFRSYRLALTDSYTAKSIRQLNSFYNSRENEEIIGSERDFDIIKSALADYISTIKGKNLIDKNLLQGVDKFLNMISTFGAVRALAGIGQFANQFASGMSNTIVNAGEHMRPSDFSKSAFDFMNKSGQPIANVGENDILISLANLDKSIERATLGKSIAEVGLDKFTKFNAKAFQLMISNPDAVARRLAWMAYYRKYVIKNKLGPIDFNADPNADAAAYAQSMVDRSMDTTDARVRGELYRSQNTYAKIIKSMLFPFSSFGMNQRTRMWGDLTKIVSGDFNLDTARSLASIGAEIAVYNVIRFQMAKLLLYAAMNLLGYDEEEQDELIEKLKKNMLSSSWSKAVVDVMSPLALADNYVLKLSNDLMSFVGLGEPSKTEVDKYIDEENKIRELKNQDPLNSEQEKKKREKYIQENAMQFYISDEANFGTLGIQWEKMTEAYDIYKAMNTGEFTDNFDRTVYLDDEGMEKIKGVAILKTIGVVAPVREVDQIANKSFSLLKKSNKISEKVKDMSAEIKKKYGKIDPVLEMLAQKKNKMSAIDDEINFINKTLKEAKKEGLTADQKIEYAKILEYIPKPDKKMLLAVKDGQTADQILKK